MSNVIKIGLLVVVAVIAALVLRGLFIAASRPAVRPPAFDNVRVAAADLPQGLLLRDDDLAWKQYRHAQTPAGAVVEGAKSGVELKGAVLRHPLAAGAPVTASDVIEANAPGFLSATLKPDMRAVSVAIDDVSGNAGLIQPGDYVDLILTQNMAGKTDSPDLSVSSEIVVQHARVLAVGSELQPTKDTTGPNLAGDANTRARTVTLEVSPHTAEAVAVAARLGSLSLALRSFATLDRTASDTSGNDATSNALPNEKPVWAGDISRAVRDLPAERRGFDAGATPQHAAARAVTIYRGSTEATLAGDSGPLPPLPSIASLPPSGPPTVPAHP
ncbi:Flp pilus assembly protein CpaB [Burkholderia sp. WAC0059]|uniref:Flp pilus assembly protein CpaB n=1 Tax=Burkholderia sp. WAC0059 TaxID=2066022 RepID=UPI000C7F567F|nr:Flp pilus assembly protein CpaB [Burkholderia sp. WAC0059]PLZ03377.1 Flp pilus assembly protein CpaB [Burkholderia sp. WAC0059]